MKKKLIITGLVAVLAVGCISASAFHGGWMGKNGMSGFKPGAEFKMPEKTEGKEMPKFEMPELTDEQKAEMKAKFLEMLNKRLEQGKITQEQYDEMLTAIENGEMIHPGMPMGKPFGFHKPEDFNPGEKGEKPEFERPELTEEQKAEMKEKPKFEMPEITEKQKAEMQEKFIKDIDKKLKNGEITQEEYDKLTEAIKNGEFAPMGRKPGMGMRGGHGRHFGPGFEKVEKGEKPAKADKE